MQKEDIPNESRYTQEDIELAYGEFGKRMADSYADYMEKSEGQVVSKQEREDMARSHIEDGVSRYHHIRAKTELEQYLISWDSITADHVAALKQALKDAKVEEDIQKFLNENRIFLIQHLGGGHGRYVIPKPELGAELVPDFLIAEMSSIGIEWHGVELESPLLPLFTSSGQASKYITHAIQQVMDWRTWLESNLAYARNPKDDNGRGLVGINSNLPATILIGRRGNNFPARFNAFRKETKSKQNIEIHTYDWLVEQAEYRVQHLQES